MGKALSKTVLAGGVVYPAGTPATADLEKVVTNPDHWTGGDDSTSAKSTRKRSTKKADSEDE